MSPTPDVTMALARDVAAVARAMMRVRGAHNGREDKPGDPPCDWCQLQAEQAVEAFRLAGIYASRGERERLGLTAAATPATTPETQSEPPKPGITSLEVFDVNGKRIAHYSQPTDLAWRRADNGDILALKVEGDRD